VARPQKKPPSLWPKEHGAYAELAFPIITAMALGSPSWAAALLALACLAGFLAHEPVLVLLGIRGRRTRDTLGGAARRHALALGSVLALTGIGGLWLASDAVRWAMLAPVVLALLVLPLIVAGREKTTPGEVLVAAAFASAGVPVALAAGVTLRVAVVASCVWLAVFVLGTFAVRLTLERARKERGPMRIVSPLAAGLSLLAALAVAGRLDWAPLGMVPTAIACLALFVRPVSAKQLRVVGWSLVGGNLFAFVTLLITLR
jgi:YwiC-like protein